MRTTEWLAHREAIISLFRRTALATWCDLEYIEDDSGEPPEEIFRPKLCKCHFVLVLISDAIPNGVKAEIRIAKENNKPILCFRQKDKQLSSDDENFLKADAYKETTIGIYASIDDLLTKIEHSLLNFIVRRLEENRNTKGLVKLAAEGLGEAPAPTPPTTAPTPTTPSLTQPPLLVVPPNEGGEPIIGKANQTQLLDFAAACVDASVQTTAIPILERAVKAKPQYPRLFKSLVALKLSARPTIKLTPDERERLHAGMSEDFDEFLLSAADALLWADYGIERGDAPAIAGEDTPLDMPIEAAIQSDNLETLVRVSKLFDEHFSGKIDLAKIDEFYAELQELFDRIEAIKSIEGIKVFEVVADVLRKRLTQIDIPSKYIPEVKCCLNCMPWDGGEAVPLSACQGTLEELTLENLYGDFPNIEWSDFEFDVSAKCDGCGSDLSNHDDVYDDWREEPEDDGSEGQEEHSS